MNLLISVKDENKKSPPPQGEKINKENPALRRGFTGQQGQHVLTLLLAIPGDTDRRGLNTEEFESLLLIFQLLDPYSNALQ